MDLRAQSKTYGKWYGVELTEENKKQFLIPEGFAHGSLFSQTWQNSVTRSMIFGILMNEGGLAWNDPEIGIDWPEVGGVYPGNASAEGYTLQDGTKLMLSEKDQKWLGLDETFSFK